MSTRDWSSDVCSSDLQALDCGGEPGTAARLVARLAPGPALHRGSRLLRRDVDAPGPHRSEERRVGKGRGTRRLAGQSLRATREGWGNGDWTYNLTQCA